MATHENLIFLSFTKFGFIWLNQNKMCFWSLNGWASFSVPGAVPPFSNHFFCTCATFLTHLYCYQLLRSSCFVRWIGWCFFPFGKLPSPPKRAHIFLYFSKKTQNVVHWSFFYFIRVLIKLFPDLCPNPCGWLTKIFKSGFKNSSKNQLKSNAREFLGIFYVSFLFKS